MARVYATVAQYEELSELPVSDEALLRKRLRAASIKVENAASLAVYAVDANGLPTDPNIADAFAEATVAVVEHWEDTGDPRGVDALEGAVKIGSVSLGTTSSGADSRSEREKLAAAIGSKAIDILENAGLRSARIAYT